MVPVVSGILIRFCAGMNQSSIEIYRTMYLTHSSLLLVTAKSPIKYKK